ncbi:hypothetical protein MNBD_GAMMA04-1756 [hydrothermal vent metagenome]|uniref:Uncharacterized protein n=1 Tax=hydrothermal vent metagenome TaxID=652676 RepID=A0A3B0WLD1_9ZZZZ
MFFREKWVVKERLKDMPLFSLSPLSPKKLDLGKVVYAT